MSTTSGKPAGHSLTAGFRFALRGILHVIRHERNMRIHLAITLAVVAAGVVFRITRTEWILIILCMGLVISAEIMNSAVERMVDLISPEKQERAGLVKDIAAGAVLVCAVTAVITGLVIFIPHIF